MAHEILDKSHEPEGYLEKRVANQAFCTNKALQHGNKLRANATTCFIRAATLNRLRRLVKPTNYTLEIGCGNATSLLGPLARDCHAYGVDLSLDMLLAAKHHTGVNGFARSDACCLPFGDASFDVVYTSRCLINVPDQGMQHLAIREAFRVAKPDATVVFVENFEEPVRRMNLTKKRLHAGALEIDEHILLLNLEKTLECSEELGWAPLWIRGNTLGSFVAHVIIGGITRQRGIGMAERLLDPLDVALTWIEDRFGKQLPLFGKDTMVVLKKQKSYPLFLGAKAPAPRPRSIRRKCMPRDSLLTLRFSHPSGSPGRPAVCFHCRQGGSREAPGEFLTRIVLIY